MIQIINGESMLAIPSIDCTGPIVVITDPPYDEKTHKGARTGTAEESKKLVTFETIDLDYIRSVFELVNQRFELRWIVATMAYRHVVELEKAPPKGIDFVRFGVWVKPNATPQFTGDRPSQGWEAVAILHKAGKKRWNGGGLPAVWIENAVQGAVYPTEKPEPLYHKFMQQFAEPGDTILDPFCGSGTSLKVAKERGLDAIGIDKSEKACEIAEKKIRQESLMNIVQRKASRASDQSKLFEDK